MVSKLKAKLGVCWYFLGEHVQSSHHVQKGAHKCKNVKPPIQKDQFQSMFYQKLQSTEISSPVFTSPWIHFCLSWMECISPRLTFDLVTWHDLAKANQWKRHCASFKCKPSEPSYFSNCSVVPLLHPWAEHAQGWSQGKDERHEDQSHSGKPINSWVRKRRLVLHATEILKSFVTHYHRGNSWLIQDLNSIIFLRWKRTTWYH